METLDAIRRRASTRAFLSREVPNETIRQLMDAARWAPSGVNTQPWQVVVVQGQSKQRLGEALIGAREAGLAENPDYDYYPARWEEPYKERRKRCGLAMYQALGIGRDDNQARIEAWYRNYRFFDAPVGLLFLLERSLGKGSWVDMGMFLQNLMLAATDAGLATCPQASLAEYPDLVRETLDLPPSLAVLGGMALGYPDPDAPVNQYRTEREPVDSFLLWRP